MTTGGKKEKSSGFRLGHLRSLDGLRGLAVLLVVVEHLGGIPMMYGAVGVNIFFVLSGFLITCLLVEEWDHTGTISLSSFYARRALRLLPALVAVILAFLIYSHFCHAPKLHWTDFEEALVALFYSTNWAYALNYDWPIYLGHTWTLSIEEQFYLLWPLLLLLLVRRTSRKSLFYFLVLAALLSWLDRFLLFAGTAATGMRIARGLDTRADTLLVGCAIGVALSSNLLPRPRWLPSVLNYGSMVSLAALGFMGWFLEMDTHRFYYTDWFLMAVFPGVIVLQLAVKSPGFIDRLLASAPLVWLGRVSYGLYLWHYPIILVLNERGLESMKKYWWLRLGLIILTTLGSYFLIERPFLKLKRHFQKAG